MIRSPDSCTRSWPFRTHEADAPATVLSAVRCFCALHGTGPALGGRSAEWSGSSASCTPLSSRGGFGASPRTKTEFENWLCHAVLLLLRTSRSGLRHSRLVHICAKPVWRRGEGHDLLFAGIHNAWDTVTYHVFRQEGRTHYRARRRGALSSSRLHVDGVWRRRGRDRFAVDGDGRDERETAARVRGIVD